MVTEVCMSFIWACEGVAGVFIRGNFIQALQVLQKPNNSNWDKRIITFHP